jgi:hypothetical protein
MTKRVVIENAKCDYCEKEIAPGQPVYTMSIDFTSYLTVSGKDRRAIEEVTGDTLAKDGDTYEYDLCEDCYWRLKDFIHKGLKNQQDKRRGLSTNNNNSSVLLALWPLKLAALAFSFSKLQA